MLLGYPISELAWLVVWIVAGGVVTGLLAGLFGIGGGGIIVPVLYEVFRVMHVSDDVRMQLCIGTSLAIIIPTTIRSYSAHKTRGAVVPDVVRTWALPAIVGVLLGAALAGFAPGWVFKVAFVVMALFIALSHVVCAGPLAARQRLAERPADAVLRLSGRLHCLADGRQRRLGLDHGADALRQADPQRGRDLGRRRRADHDCRRARLYGGRLVAYGCAAAVFARLRVVGRFCGDGAGVELHGVLRRAAGALATAPQARNRLRLFSIIGVGCASWSV